VYDSCEQTKDLLHKKHMLQEEIAMLRLEIDALKNQHQEKEENYFEDIEILKQLGADSKEKTVISIQHQFQQIVRKLQAKYEKQGLMLEKRNKELIKEWNHLKERMYWDENEKAEE
ncbi:putative ankyrin repeat domain-containing protein 26-like 1, partial [Bos mutus]|uniref:putative ankyrin repeat domain-containing protein 26-like 1 n=1 Tax=Bos mutus TaxID=72004 RepID=UPI0003C03C2D